MCFSDDFDDTCFKSSFNGHPTFSFCLARLHPNNSSAALTAPPAVFALLANIHIFCKASLWFMQKSSHGRHSCLQQEPLVLISLRGQCSTAKGPRPTQPLSTINLTFHMENHSPITCHQQHQSLRGKIFLFFLFAETLEILISSACFKALHPKTFKTSPNSRSRSCNKSLYRTLFFLLDHFLSFFWPSRMYVLTGAPPLALYLFPLYSTST